MWRFRTRRTCTFQIAAPSHPCFRQYLSYKINGNGNREAVREKNEEGLGLTK